MSRPWGLALGLVLAASAAPAQEGPETTFHGFGGNAYGNTSDNRYLAGSPGGEYQNAQFALAASASVSEKLHVSSQVSWKGTTKGTAVDLDYAFAEWWFSDGLRLRAGRAKQPFGIYTEIFDVGTVRPFYALPQGIYGPAALVAKGYDGLGLTGRMAAASGWAVQYDLYFGGVRLDQTPLAGLEEEADEEDHGPGGVEIIRDALGANLDVETPVGGLRFGASVYSGHEQRADQVRHTVFGVHAEYLTGPWSLRSEYVWHPEKDGPDLRAFYLEAARRLGAHWQVAARYDWSDTVLSSGEALPARSLGKQEDAALGLNYWFGSGLVLKLSYHHVNGNRFARPEDLEEALEKGTLASRTDLVQFGAQFSF